MRWKHSRRVQHDAVETTQHAAEVKTRLIACRIIRCLTEIYTCIYTSQNLWLQNDRHFVGIVRHGIMSAVNGRGFVALFK